MESDKRAVSRLMRISNAVNALCERALFVTIVLMTLTTSLQIVCRVWFKALTWSEELTRFLLVFASFFGVCVAFRRGANITVNFLRDALPGKARRVLLTAIEAVGIVFFAAVGWFGAQLCIQEKTQMASSLPVSMSLIYMIFPVTSVIVIIHLCARIHELIKHPESGEEAK